MTTRGAIHSVGGYLPSLRLSRRAALAALRWSGLGGPKEGYRSVAGWDEEPLTLAVEASRGLTAELGAGDIVFASTSAYFTERAQSALLVEALGLPSTCPASDVAGSRRSATSALMRALESTRNTIVAAGEKRPTQAGSGQQLLFGDGGAAARIAAQGPARYVGGASLTCDFVDFYASRDHPTPYAYEERFVRESAVNGILAPTILAACEAAGVEPARIALAAVAEPVSGVYPLLAKKIGLAAPNLGAELVARAGDLGAAHPLFAMGLAFARAVPGDLVLVVGFGSGCDALIFEVTAPVPGASALEEMLGRGVVLDDYVRFLSLSDAVSFAWGMRAEFEQKTQATVLDRYGRDMIGFVGGRDSTGNVQFPKSRIPVNPALQAPEPLEDVRLADEIGRIVSVTADRLNFTPDPPFHFGLIQFDNGARVMVEFTDGQDGGFVVGDRVRMRLRIKGADSRRGFRTYFWKAAPLERQALEVA